jgi:hypothetical protein
MKLAILVLALLQATQLAGLATATMGCDTDRATAMHQGHDTGTVPDGPDACTHCPPVGCATHSTCSVLAAAVVAGRTEAPLAPLTRDTFTRIVESPPDHLGTPPVAPPRLIA